MYIKEKKVMKDKNKYIPIFGKSEIDKVQQKLDPQKNRACNNNILFTAGLDSYSGNYYGHSLKRSNLRNCTFDNAEFDHTSFCGSVLSNIVFKASCKFESVYMEQSMMTDIIFEKGLHMENCNFSNSHIKNMSLNSSEIRGVYFDNCILVGCSFENCKIRASMFDGAVLTNCSIINCNMRNLNIEFATIQNCDLSGTIISYFQLPYIIGIFSKTNITNNTYAGIHKTETITIDEYIDNINDAIIYFTGLEEYFPLANLYYAKGEKEIAYNCIINGIDKALINYDIRMVENYCKLGQICELLSVSDIQKILKKVDSKIEKERHHSMYGLLLSKSYQLKASINQNYSKSKLEIIINTNIAADRFDLVSKFCDDIDNIISTILPNKVSTTYQFSHNSPFEICLTCVGITADLITLAGPIYHYISKKMKNNVVISPELQEYIKSSNTMYIDSINNQFDLFEQST
jgi:uncharacterized protein YjbI with pentapeptide repeats